MIEPHDLHELTARLGAPHLEQITHRRGERARVHFYWGCGCTGIGTPEEAGDRTAVRWSRCDHHGAAEQALV
jgi:hypothetical protein